MATTAPATTTRLASAIHLARPKLSIQGALYTLLGAYLASDGAHPFTPRVVGAAVVVGLIIAASFVINDYHDRSVDGLSKPERPIPSGRVSLPVARLMAFSLAALALALVSLLGPVLALMAVGNLALSILYSYVLKGTVLIGNAVIAALDASILLFGSLAVGRVPLSIWALCALAFLHVFAQEVLSALADKDGDAAMGLATAATRLGAPASLLVFRLAVLSFAALAVAAPMLGLLPTRFLLVALPCSIVPTLVVMLTVQGAEDAVSLARALRVLRYVWIASLIPVFLVKPLAWPFLH